MAEKVLYPRFAEQRLTEALADSPIMLIHGPRQSGKTTLAQTVGERKGYAYVSFDDNVSSAARRLIQLVSSETCRNGRFSTKCSACRRYSAH